MSDDCADEPRQEPAGHKPKEPLDLLLDIALFAPLGLVSDFEKVVPELATRGRHHLDMSRVLGRAALRAMSGSGEKSAARRSATSASPTEPSRSSSGDSDRSAKSQTGQESPKSQTGQQSPKSQMGQQSLKSQERVGTDAENGLVAVSKRVEASYRDWTAREAIARSKTASTSDLTWMRDQEHGGKRRKTVLAAIDRALGAHHTGSGGK